MNCSLYAPSACFLNISSSWAERSLYAEFQLPSMSGSGISMVVDKTTTKNWVKLEASLAPDEAEVGVVAKGDQKYKTQPQNLRTHIYS
jgi:hypothetical protein